MNNPQLGLEKPVQQAPLAVGAASLPLAPLPTQQQGSPSMSRLAISSQGGRPTVRSSNSGSGGADISGEPGGGDDEEAADPHQPHLLMSNNIISNNSTITNNNQQQQQHPTLVSSLNSPVNVRKTKLPSEDYVILRRKLSDHQELRLSRLQTRYAENCALLCFLQSSGNIADYNSWRSRLPAVPLNNFLRTNKLDPDEESENLVDSLKALNPSLLQTALAGNKNGQDVAPESISSNPPSAASSVSAGSGSEKGGEPPVPVKLPKMSPGRPATPVKVVNSQETTAATPSASTTPTATPSSNCQEQIVERAKQEAYVMQRIGELQKDGLWAEKRLPKIHELPRVKAHWDYLIEEMAWLAADFAQERKWKKAAAKKCARMVQKYFQEKEALALKAKKAQEMQLKRIAAFIAKEVKQFWTNVEKLVEFKQQTRLEEKRKKALDQHLSFIVDQTEKYSSLVAESMNISRPTSPKHHSDVEFEPEGSSDDDEETIAKEEALSGRDTTSISEEVSALQRESELPLEDLLSDYLEKRDSLPVDSPVSDPPPEEDDDDFRGSDKETSDDEETIQEQEQNESTVDYKKEIDELKAEGDMSIDELRAKYGLEPDAPKKTESAKQKSGATASSSKRGPPPKRKGDDEEDEELDSDDEEEDEDEEEEGSDDEEMDVDESSESEKEEDSALKSLLNDAQHVDEKPGNGDKDKEINDVAAIAQSLQPKGNTLSSTSVVTKVPFLLKHTLREYQHIGLDWLVTMYDRKLNGILADEMGLGKTIQTIALIAHLACEKGNWGPHLIVVPTSVMLNWEVEFKKWCPAFKILTYYGTQKERKMKRSGWTKPNAFHICITSYKLVTQDHQSFRRKKWKYLILDEAQNIKNFKSQRWQLLLNFKTQRRLLLTGTPLQNNLMELWSLMHFLMPNVFESHREFKEWFSNPVTGMIEGNSEYNDTIIKRLHKVLRPFLLRRLKSEVETQMPKKYEHVVMCRLSNRQRYLYDDFMSRAKTKETLASGSLLSVINVLMQLRKVCNHPNLFEVRPTVSPFQMEGLVHHLPSLVYNALEYDPFKHVDLCSLNLLFVEFERWLLAFVAHRIRTFKIPSEVILGGGENTPLNFLDCPKSRIRVKLKKRILSQNQLQNQIRPTVVQVANNHRIFASIPPAKVGTSPVIKLAQNSTQGVTLRLAANSTPGQVPNYLQLIQPQGVKKAISLASGAPTMMKTTGPDGSPSRIVPQFAQLVNTPQGRQLVLSPQPVLAQTQGTTTTTVLTGGQRLTVVSKLVNPNAVAQMNASRPIVRVPPLNVAATPNSTIPQNFITATTMAVSSSSSPTVSNEKPHITTAPVVLNTSPSSKVQTRQNSGSGKSKDETQLKTDLRDEQLEEYRKRRRKEKLERLARINEMRCHALPIYGPDLRSSIVIDEVPGEENWRWTGYAHCRKVLPPDPRLFWTQTKGLRDAVHSIEERVAGLSQLFSRFVLCVPAVTAPVPRLHVAHPCPSKMLKEDTELSQMEGHVRPRAALLHPIASRMSTQFPDRRLIQYDCGKLQALDRLLRQLRSGHHRVLIFTQMTRMLDILEAFLNFHGHIYLRLDGTTKVEQRQLLMERFNADKRIFCFILSTRSGGVGINLTGADTVIFYDSDWNPTMDAQAQDRCHRIGQTRDVHIYRLVSEKTVEENILKKANQKRILGDVAIEGGNFTTAYFKSSTIQDLFNVDVSENDASRRMAEVLLKEKAATEDSAVTLSVEEKNAVGALENALAQAEDETDVAAARVAKAEAAAELAEFDENIPIDGPEGQAGEMSRAELELNNLMQQLNGVERYAMKFMEETDAAWTAEQLAAAEAELEQQKREWEAGRLAALKAERESVRAAMEEDDEILTYSGADARNQLWISNDGREIMPMWCPPTPPQDDNDMFIDQSLCLLYEPNIMTESQLPPVFVKKERKRSRFEAGLTEGRGGPVKVRQRDDTLLHAPRSLFDRPSPALLKMRQELRLQRYRGIMRPSVQTLVKPQLPVKPLPEPEHVPDWIIQEDWAILQAIQQYQELTLNLIILSPGHTPNWDFVAENVNMTSRTYRCPKQCKARYETVIMPREEGKMVFDNSPKKQKKTKTLYKLPQMKSGRPLRTSQLYQQDNNASLSQIMNSRYDAIRSVSNRRAPTVKPLLVDPAMKNPKHAEVLADCAIDYEKPLGPVDVASKRAERLAKEKALSQQGVITTEQQLAVLRLQQQQLHNAAKASVATSSATVTTSSASTSTRQVTVQLCTGVTTAGQGFTEIASGVATGRALISSPTSQSLTRSASTGLVSVQPGTNPVKGTKTLSPAQLQLYRQQQALLRQQQQQQLRVLHSRAPATGQKVSVAVTAGSPTQRVQQVKAGGVTRTVSEQEMVALLKRQQQLQQKGAPPLTSAQLLAQTGLHVGQPTSVAGQIAPVATLVKTLPASSLPVTGLTLPQMKATLGSGLKANAVTSQQLRQLSLQQQIIAQHRKIPQQKVAQIGQVATKSGATAQLIVQSQKSIPTTMTMQQIQQVMKHVQPQHVVSVAQGTTAQVVPHTVFTKTQGGSQQARVIPVSASTQQSLKQAIQVVTGTSGSVTPTRGMSLDSSVRNATTLGALKTNTSQQQAILTQVSAVLQGGGGVRQPVRIQAASAPIVAVAVSQAPTVLTLPPHDTNQQQ